MNVDSYKHLPLYLCYFRSSQYQGAPTAHEARTMTKTFRPTQLVFRFATNDYVSIFFVLIWELVERLIKYFKLFKITWDVFCFLNKLPSWILSVIRYALTKHTHTYTPNFHRQGRARCLCQSSLLVGCAVTEHNTDFVMLHLLRTFHYTLSLTSLRFC
jgi:hypothetical protein